MQNLEQFCGILLFADRHEMLGQFFVGCILFTLLSSSWALSINTDNEVRAHFGKLYITKLLYKMFNIVTECNPPKERLYRKGFIVFIYERHVDFIAKV